MFRRPLAARTVRLNELEHAFALFGVCGVQRNESALKRKEERNKNKNIVYIIVYAYKQ